MDTLDPETSGTFGSPDATLQDWLKDPAAAEFIKKKALEHAQSTLGFSDPYGNNLDANSGMPTTDKGTPVPPPLPTYVMDKGPATGVTPKGSTPPPGIDQPAASATVPDPINPLDPSVPMPQPRPAEAGPGASDISASKKKKDESDDTGIGKVLAGLKALQPPPVNAVGTPSVRSPNAINAPNLSQILQLMGSHAAPDPMQTLGRLLVAGKA